jgi:hypothetical protein
MARHRKKRIPCVSGTFGLISNIPPNAQSCLQQTGGPAKLKIPRDIIPSRPPGSHYSVARL